MRRDDNCHALIDKVANDEPPGSLTPFAFGQSAGACAG
jgi:hypothetical protein